MTHAHQTLTTLNDHDLTGKTALIRVDLNVPMQGNTPTDITRLRHAIPTIKAVLKNHGKPVLLSHFGRPKGRDPAYSTAVIAPHLSALLNTPVIHCPDCIGTNAAQAIKTLPEGSVLLLENTRFYAGETANDPAFSADLARLGDIFIADAFSVAHRAHASTTGIARHIPACAGLGLSAEITALSQILHAPNHPVMAIVGGAKVSTKLSLLENLLDKMDYLVIGGGMANTFLGANGAPVGRSLCEPALFETARTIQTRAQTVGCKIILPSDIVVAKDFRPNAPHETRLANDCPDDAMILDAGDETIEHIYKIIALCKTVVWNGPLGAFETPPFDIATNRVARAVGRATVMGHLTSVGGGGDTIAALTEAGADADFTYLCTAGGAFLEWLEGKVLPGVAILMKT